MHVEVDGLEPDRWYFYRFMAGDAQSAVGRTRTFPAPDAEAARLRIAYASCQRWEHGYFSAYRHMREENLDAVLFLGDYIYEYPNARNAVRVPTGGWVLTLDDYRQRYALHKSEADLQAMHAACPWLVTWDDHEVQNDYAGLKEGDSGPPVASFAARRAEAYQAYYEHMPLRASVLTQALAGLATGAEMRIYSEARFGQLATFYLLDDRQYRDPHACSRGAASPDRAPSNPATCAEWTDPRRTLLGAAQERWLDAAFAAGGQGLERRRAANAVRAAGLQVRTRRVVLERRLGRLPGRARTAHRLDAEERARQSRPAGRRRAPELGRAREGRLCRSGEPRDRRGVLRNQHHARAPTTAPASPAWLAENPHFVFADAERRGYGVVELTPTQLTTSLRVVDDVTRRDTTIDTLARFTVRAGRPVIERT